MPDQKLSEHKHIYSINYGYERIECMQYQQGCDEILDEDEAERRINEFLVLEAKLEMMKRALINMIAAFEQATGVNVMEALAAAQEEPKNDQA